MRQYAYLKEPAAIGGEGPVDRIMLYEAPEGTYLFGFRPGENVRCAFDRLYESAEYAREDWDALVDDRGWVPLNDPLPGCQHDSFLPVRVKGRDTGKPEWGRYEILRDGEWVEYRPDRDGA